MLQHMPKSRKKQRDRRSLRCYAHIRYGSMHRFGYHRNVWTEYIQSSRAYRRYVLTACAPTLGPLFSIRCKPILAPGAVAHVIQAKPEAPHGVYCPTPPSSSSSSSSSLPSSSSQPSASNPLLRIPKLIKHPTKAIPPKTPKARASPLGLTWVASEKSPPERKGPAARPAAESVCARPLMVPRTEWFGAELVIYIRISVAFSEVATA